MSSGAWRPIGLLSSFMRIWARARAGVIARWADENGRSYLHGGSGSGAQRAAWLQAARAELAEATGKHFAQELIDLAKCFEHVPHHLLVRFAIKHGYNLWVLRLSIATYRCERTIRIEGAFSRTIVANRGIVAGSVFAVVELRL